MEFTTKKKAFLLALFTLSYLLLPRASSAALLSRSLSLTLRNQQQPSGPALEELPAQGALGARSLGEVAATARVDIEVNDYPGSGANNRHEPRSPGRP